MTPTRTKVVAVVAALGLLLWGAVGAVGGAPLAADGHQQAATQESAESTCAVEPPASLSDPPQDVVGWEDGVWYNESIGVDQTDGLNRSEQAALVARTKARVEAVRCAEFEREVPVSVISREQYREQQAGRNVSPALRTFDNAKFEALFMVGESADSIAVQQRNRGSSVLGFYSPRQDEIVVISEDRESLRIDELTLAHELMHAWQDGEFNLSSEELRPRLRDEANARNGLVEGSASFVEHLYEQRCTDGDWSGTCRTVERGGGGGQLANFGIYLVKYQPYSDGPAFVRTVHTVGGWDAVDALYERPPESTEQVIHVEKYGTDPPEDIDLTDRATDDWNRVEPPGRPSYASVGEAALMSMFVYPYYHSEGEQQLLAPDDWLNYDEQGDVRSFDPLDYESNYSAGWDGDRLHVYRNGTGELGYVWRLAWDSPQDARQFVEGYRQLLRYWGAERVGENTYRIPEGESGFADAFHVRVEGTTVTVVNAPTVDQLDEVRTGVGNVTGGQGVQDTSTAG